MKKTISFLILMLFGMVSMSAQDQSSNDVLVVNPMDTSIINEFPSSASRMARSTGNYIVSRQIATKPRRGLKIRTNFPFQNGTHVGLLNLRGFFMESATTLDIELCWYIQNGKFTGVRASSKAGKAPDIWLSNEGGKVIIFIDDNREGQTLTVYAYPHTGYNQSHYQGWTIDDDPIYSLTGNNSVKVPFTDVFAGKVGIGVDNPKKEFEVNGAISAKTLEVNGLIRAKEVKIEATGWADFVFGADYKLATLSEVEDHIKEHKHLPNIPSEAQVKEEGVNVVEMQTKLLQKIEELTLYTIQQQKQLEEQSKQIQELQQVVKNK